jgi:hypothetical protein
MAGLVRVLVAVALTATAALVLGGCANAVVNSALKVGDCVNNANTTDANGDAVESNVVVACSEAHDEEVFSVFTYPNATSTFPGYEAIGAAEQTQCENDFTDYVGVPWEQSATYSIDYLGPTDQSWSNGDRVIVCLLDDAGGAKLTGSAKDSAQ